MSQTLIFFLPLHWTLEMVAERIERDVGRKPMTVEITEDRPGRRSLHVTCNPDYAIVDKLDAAAVEEDQEFYRTSEDIDEKFRREVDSLSYFFLMSNDFSLMREMLVGLARQVIADGMTAWIDTGHGWVLDGRELLARTAVESGWDWRYRLPGQ